MISCLGQDTRLDEEESICQPFLTSPRTSPLQPVHRAARNLSIDDEGEWACLQVLRDENLPLQIRVTIHEGLYVSDSLAVQFAQLI